MDRPIRGAVRSFTGTRRDGAAWDSKYGYDRPRPSAIKADLKAVVPNPLSPSYPAEDAAAAGAAAEVLAYLIPDREGGGLPSRGVGGIHSTVE
jgi:hypothetical protein